MFKKTAFFAVLMSLIFVMVSFAAEDVRIGLVTPLTGDVATFGESTRNAAVLWAEEVNAKGGLLGGKVVLAIEDDRNIPAETANAVQKLISQNKVVAVVGSVASKCTLAGAPIAQAAKVPMISPTSTNEAVTKVGDYIFRACFIDPFQGTVMAKFAYTKLNARNAAMLYDIGNDYTKGLAENFKKAFEALGGKIVASETYGVGESDFSAQLTKIRSARPDVLFLPDYYNSVGLQAKQARQLGITATFLGGDGWDSSELVPIGGSAI
ncbi:MAG TPA: ABC transporter substrate-binding protein, partial [Bacillota bacterium]|nr:ABC transporter substrate-binding protein [Bacillota bacterium]